MEPVLKVLAEYLEGKSNKWGEIAHKQLESVFEWISDGSLIPREQLRESRLAEELSTLLLSPIAVSHYASLGSKEAIERAMTLRVHAAVKTFEVPSTLIPEDLSDLELQLGVLGGRYHPVLNEPVLDDSDFRSAGESTFRPYEGIWEEWHASIDLLGEPEQGLADRSTEKHTNTSLEIIDHKLYSAILNDPELMRSVGWREFEKFLARILEEFGYSIDLQRGTKDGGVDIFALKKTGVFGAEKYLVQAKRWKNSVGVAPVRELAFLHGELKMTRSCLATTASFTRGAWELADLHKWQLDLKDFEGLKNWVKDAKEIRRVGPLVKSSGGIYIPEK